MFLQLQLFLHLIIQIPLILWTLIEGLLDWFIPSFLRAKAVDQDIVLITGAGSGLGRAIALEYANLNSSLVLWDINRDGLDETKSLVEAVRAEISSREEKNNGSEAAAAKPKLCLTYVVDVSDRAEVKKFADQVHLDLNRGHQIDDGSDNYVSVLVNNAGIYHGLLLTELRDDQIERIFKINMLAHFWTVRAFLPKMIEHERGHIVEIASMAGIAGLLKQVDYCATKFATVGFEESLSIELDHLGLADKIHTTVVCPFFFSSNLFTGFNANVASLMSAEYVAKEAVNAMRCNYSRILLPKLQGYSLSLFKPFVPRKTIKLMTRVMRLSEGIKEIKGKAAEIKEVESY